MWKHVGGYVHTSTMYFFGAILGSALPLARRFRPHGIVSHLEHITYRWIMIGVDHLVPRLPLREKVAQVMRSTDATQEKAG